MRDDAPLIHLVHQDSDVLLTLYEVLSAAGFHLGASTRALDGLGHIARSKPRAILCPWDLSGMSGREFLLRVRHSSPESHIVMSSPRATASLYDEVLEAGADDLLREPLNPLAVVHAVSRMLGFNVPYMAREASESKSVPGRARRNR